MTYNGRNGLQECETCGTFELLLRRFNTVQSFRPTRTRPASLQSYGDERAEGGISEDLREKQEPGTHTVSSERSAMRCSQDHDLKYEIRYKND